MMWPPFLAGTQALFFLNIIPEKSQEFRITLYSYRYEESYIAKSQGYKCRNIFTTFIKHWHTVHIQWLSIKLTSLATRPSILSKSPIDTILETWPTAWNIIEVCVHLYIPHCYICKHFISLQRTTGQIDFKLVTFSMSNSCQLKFAIQYPQII